MGVYTEENVVIKSAVLMINLVRLVVDSVHWMNRFHKISCINLVRLVIDSVHWMNRFHETSCINLVRLVIDSVHWMNRFHETSCINLVRLVVDSVHWMNRFYETSCTYLVWLVMSWSIWGLAWITAWWIAAYPTQYNGLRVGLDYCLVDCSIPYRIQWFKGRPRLLSGG